MIFELKNLSFGHGRAKVLQSQINFKLSKGETLHVKGPNGSGKSTLLKVIRKELAPLSGEVELGIDLKEFAYLPQMINYELSISLSFKEILSSYDLLPKIYELMSSDFLSKMWHTASGGERQKLLILTRLEKDKKVLVLDEPFNHVDHKGQKDIEVFLNKILKAGILDSLIVVSHFDIELDQRRELVFL